MMLRLANRACNTEIRQRQPWTLHSFRRRPVYFICDSPYKYGRRNDFHTPAPEFRQWFRDREFEVMLVARSFLMVGLAAVAPLPCRPVYFVRITLIYILL
jgi:hypothetical protein